LCEASTPASETLDRDSAPEMENRCTDDAEGHSTTPDSNASSWGSGQSARQRPMDALQSLPDAADKEIEIEQAGEVTMPVTAVDVLGAPGNTPFVWVYTDTPASSASNGGRQPPVTPVCLDDFEAIFDLNRFNDDGEEREAGADVNATQKAAPAPSNKFGCRQVKFRFPSRKPSVQSGPCRSDVRPSDVFSASGSNSSGGTQSGAQQSLDKSWGVSSSGDSATPTWPPRLAGEVNEPDVDDVVVSEALTLAKTLSTCAKGSVGLTGMSQHGSPPSVTHGTWLLSEM
jgi:hypothetical protein